jgi:hypothetical protein
MIGFSGRIQPAFAASVLLLLGMIQGGRLHAQEQAKQDISDEPQQPAAAEDGAAAPQEARVIIEAVEAGGRNVENDGEINQVTKVRMGLAKKHLKAQLAFFATALELSAEQKESIAKLDNKWLLQKVQSGAKPKGNVGGALLKMMGGGAVVRFDQAGDQDPVVIQINKNIDNALNELITEEQKQQLNEERAAKDACHNQALAELAVSLIERHIFINDEQATKLVPALTGKINKNCGWSVYLSNPQFVPTIPLKDLAGVLNAEQIALVKSLNQQDFVGNNFNLMQMMGIQEVEEENIADELLEAPDP